MRILVCGDTHGNTSHVITLLDRALSYSCDRIWILGDFGYWEHEYSGIEFLSNVNRHATNRDLTVYFLDGNHDKTSLLLKNYSDERDEEGFIEVRPRILYAPRGHVWTWQDTTFMALGGAYSIDKDYRLWLEEQRGNPEAYWFPEEEMSDEDLDRYLAAAPDTVDILLTHDKPRSSNPAWNRKDIPECWPNQDRIQKAVMAKGPDRLFHGHLHYRYNDTIRSSNESGWTGVHGLDSDPASAGNQKKDESCYVLDLDENQRIADDD